MARDLMNRAANYHATAAKEEEVFSWFYAS
jgi:hypothetical protein